MQKPALVLSDSPIYTKPFHADPWPEHNSTLSHSNPPSHGGSPHSFRSSSSSNPTYPRVLSESEFSKHTTDDGLTVYPDPYFGNRDVARFCASFLVQTFHSQEETETSRRLHQPKLSIFIAQLIYFTGIPFNIVMGTLMLLQRLRNTLPTDTPPLSGHRLFLGALMHICNEESTQGIVPEAGAARFWSTISRFSESEVDEMYDFVYDQLGGNVVVFPSYAAALEKLRNPLCVKNLKWEDEEMSDPESDESSLQSSPSSKSKTPKCARLGLGASPRPSIRSRISSAFKFGRRE